MRCVATGEHSYNVLLIMQKNLTPVSHQLTFAQRNQRYGHGGGVIWLTGLSAAGKSTLAMALEQRLLVMGYACYALDGDNIRKGLNANLGFSPEDRSENIRRVAEVAALFADAGLVCITALISPYLKDRQLARAIVQKGFHEVYVAAGLSVCESRDPKGLYRKARSGMLDNFTGISAPYEAPLDCELVLDTGRESIDNSLEKLVAHVQKYFPLASAPDRNNG